MVLNSNGGLFITSLEVGSRPSAKAGGPADKVLIHIAVGGHEGGGVRQLGPMYITGEDPPDTGDMGNVEIPF